MEHDVELAETLNDDVTSDETSDVETLVEEVSIDGLCGVY
jgi:mycofactocin precursor